MTVIRVKAPELKDAYTRARIIKDKIASSLDNPEVIILGPIPPTISKVDSLYIFNIIIKYKIVPELDIILKNVFEEEISKGTLISLDRFPTSF